jgi:hypothetical protein
LGGLLQIHNIYATGFTLDNSRAKWLIDPQHNGFMSYCPTVTYWQFHFEPTCSLFWPFSYSFRGDVFARNVRIDIGASLRADPHSGVPVVNFYNSYIDLAQSSIQLSGDCVVQIIGWFANFFKAPLNVIIN